MNRPGTVGIVIPTFNRPDLVSLAVASARAQTRPATAIVVVDDGGSIPLPDALRTLEAEGGVQLLRIANGGTARARNAGAAVLETDYLLFLDDDDTLYPEALAGLAGVLDAHPEASAVSGGGRRRFGDRAPRDPEWPCTAPMDFEALMRGNALFNSATLIRRETFMTVGGYEATVPLAEDWDLWLKLTRHGPIVPSETVAVEYFVHGGNLTRSSKVPRMAVTLVGHYWPRLPRETRARVETDLAGYMVGHYVGDLAWFARQAARRGELRACLRDLNALRQLLWFAVHIPAGRAALRARWFGPAA